MKILLSVLLAACLIITMPLFLHDAQGKPFLEPHINLLMNYPTQYQAWQRITDQFLPPQYDVGTISATSSEVASKTIEKWRDAKGVTHFTELAQDDTAADGNMKTVIVTAGHTYVSQMPSQRTTYFFTTTAWLTAVLLWLGILWLLGKIYALQSKPKPTNFSRTANFQAINKQRPEVSLEFQASSGRAAKPQSAQVFPIRKPPASDRNH